VVSAFSRANSNFIQGKKSEIHRTSKSLCEGKALRRGLCKSAKKKRFLAGVIDRDKVPPFELMLWRICRGNVFLRTAEIEEVLEDPKLVSF
jgi:V-type H+-transporting ATPase subunit a